MKKQLSILGATMLFSTVMLGSVNTFAATTPDPSTAETPVTAKLTIPNPTKPTPPTGSEGGGDKEEPITGGFGIAYTPASLSGTADLKTTGNQEISLSHPVSTGTPAVTKYNVGVQDKTRKKDQNWQLKASLSWIGDTNNYMAGTSIKTTDGTVKENIAGVLQTANPSEVSAANTELSIGDTEVEVMNAINGQTMNGVYNYQFQNPKLSIPDVTKVSAGDYTGKINWNLSTTP